MVAEIDDQAAEPEKLGERATRTETTTRWFNADGQLTGELRQTQVTYVKDDLPFPAEGYL